MLLSKKFQILNYLSHMKLPKEIYRFYLEIHIEAKFKTFGCGSAIASSSLVTEWLKGANIDEAQSIKNTEIATELALPPVKIHCSVLAEDAVKSAINDYKRKCSCDD